MREREGREGGGLDEAEFDAEGFEFGGHAVWDGGVGDDAVQFLASAMWTKLRLLNLEESKTAMTLSAC